METQEGGGGVTPGKFTAETNKSIRYQEILNRVKQSKNAREGLKKLKGL